jgi:hypothetical protein
MYIELNEDQTRALIQTLLFEIEATKQLLSMEEDHSQSMEDAMGDRLDELLALKAEIKALKVTQKESQVSDLPIVKSVKMVRGNLPKATKKVVEPVKRGRGRPKKVAA